MPLPRTLSPPMDKKVALKEEKPSKQEPTSQSREPEAKPKAQPTNETPVIKEQPPDSKETKDVKPPSSADIAQPLAPPPRPAPSQNPSEQPDYFSAGHSSSSYSLEPNLFEQSFGTQPSTETPGKTILPPVGSLTSPAPLTGGNSLGTGYNWANSLRSGPLSPAMLSGPTGSGDYFDSSHLLRGGGITPNESSLRTGLTPGGGGSMFPAASPGSALYSQLLSGAATPGTVDFHRTAMTAAANRKSENVIYTNGNTSQPQDPRPHPSTMDSTASAPAASHQHFGQHDNDAANGLYLLAQAGNESQSQSQFSQNGRPAGNASQNTSPTMNNNTKKSTRPNTGSIDSTTHDQSEINGNGSADNDQSKPNTRNKSKRTTSTKSNPARRKAEETPSKPPAAKKAKQNNGAASVNSMDFDAGSAPGDSDDDEMMQDDMADMNNGNKKMTDEEKRKNFLERNRVAALKCRQRKKQWLANLQAKVEIFSSENDALAATIASLREEVLNLKTILIAHKDCPIAQQQQGVGQYIQTSHDYASHQNPYGMGMQSQQQVLAGPRRFS